MRISVIGTGYVGLVTAACFAARGSEVVCVDIDERKIADLNVGVIPIVEPGLDDLVSAARREGRLSFTSSMQDALRGAEVCFIAVGTPPEPDGRADISQVLAAADSIIESAEAPITIVVKSTVPVGTNGLLARRTARAARGSSFTFASNPEFLKEGDAVADCMEPERVVIGAANDRDERLLRELYAPFADSERVLVMSPEAAEMTKYASNAMLAARISFMNEIADLCDAVGCDVEDVRRGMASDPRIGPHFLRAGCGYGGSCFPKDVRALRYLGEANGIALQIASAIDSVNRRQKEALGMMVRGRFGDSVLGMRAAVLGLAFKPNTDDVREAPSVTLIRRLIDMGAIVSAYDPAAVDKARAALPMIGVEFATSASDALRGADFAVIVTEWREFAELDWEAAARSMRGRTIFDGRNILDPKRMDEIGIEYLCIGRGRRASSSKLTSQN